MKLRRNWNRYIRQIKSARDIFSEDIEVVLIDIKSGSARLTKGQMAIADAIREGRVRFETIRIDFQDKKSKINI